MFRVENGKLFLRCIQWTSGGIGILLNTILIILIVYRSPKTLGTYKYLMIYISLFELFYCNLDSITEPHAFTYGPVILVFRYFKHSIFGRKEGFYLVLLYCGSFGLSIALFAVHFIYRYGVADNNFRKKYLMGHRLMALCSMPLVCGACWAGIEIFLFRSSFESDSFMRIPLLQGYDSRIEDISYMVLWFYVPSINGQLKPNWSAFIGMLGLWLMMSSSFFCVFYFGINCYIKISKALKKSKMSSYYTRSIQHQLFQALVIQTLIPVVLMYVPAGIVFVFPMLNIEVGFVSSFVTATIAIYPAVDPLPTMFLVESYRKTILCGCQKDTKTTSGNSADLQN